ncbi:MAG: winged helix-turn-helix transcriptional regulator [Clostridia bacterium]|nr:winged helix-turn-helix transcriptional regulator [Clostridia bacterium]
MSHIHLPHDHGADSAFVAQNMPEPCDFASLSAAFKHLSDSSRLRIFWLLCHCEECVINISALVGMSSPAVSHHLRLLKDAGYITSRRAGNEVYYTAAKTKTAQLLHDMIKQLLELECPQSCHFE